MATFEPNRRTIEPGAVFNRLVAVEPVQGPGKARWLFKCTCGTELVRTAKDVRCGYIKSCGCLYRERRPAIEAGQRFGQLTVIQWVRLDKKHVGYECKCDCGNVTRVRTCHLRNGCTVSCGCHGKQVRGAVLRGEYGASSCNAVFACYRIGARKRRLSFQISLDDFLRITRLPCHYCGASPSNLKKSKGHFGEFRYNGIDRIDNSLGYEESNIIPCCVTCNRAKRDMGYREFLDWISRVYRFIVASKRTPREAAPITALLF